MDMNPIPLITSVDTEHFKVTAGELDFSANQDVNLHYWQGSFLEQFDFTIAEAGGIVTGSLEKENTGDLTMFFSDEYTVLDCTPPTTVNLTSLVGTDTAPAAAFVYIPQSTKTLTAAASWPSAATEHIRVASIILQSAATTGTQSALMNRNWNDEAFSIDDPRGDALHTAERLRFEHALWNTGVVLSITGSGTGTVTLDTTSGTVYQMHLHEFSALDMAGADDIHLVNLSGSEYSASVNLVADITTLADGVTAIANNKYFNIVIWGVQNRTGEASHLMCNLPTGQYTKSADATVDAMKFSVHTIPSAFRGTGFLIAELTFRLTGAGTTWTTVQNKDLLGQTPTLTPGGGTTTNITIFSDSAFEIFDNNDDAKRFDFEASGITTGNTRTLTVPDDNGTIAFTKNYVENDLILGDGSDGALSTSGNVTLTRNMFYSSLTVNSGHTIFTAGFKIFCTGTVNVAAGGFIDRSGNAGSGVTAGAALASAILGGSAAGGAGGGGGNDSAGDPGSAGGSANGEGGNGAAGGDGGDSDVSNSGGTAGAAGTVTVKKVRHLTSDFFVYTGTTLIQGGAGGSGGGGGAGDPVEDGGSGGGGGSGAGIIAIYANIILIGGTISAIGGAGAAGGSGDAASGGGGGGAGGGGGYVYLVYKTLTNNGTLSVAGGAGGAAGVGGNENGVVGAAGSAGNKVGINLTTGVYDTI